MKNGTKVTLVLRILRVKMITCLVILQCPALNCVQNFLLCPAHNYVQNIIRSSKILCPRLPKGSFVHLSYANVCGCIMLPCEAPLLWCCKICLNQYVSALILMTIWKRLFNYIHDIVPCCCEPILFLLQLDGKKNTKLKEHAVYYMK